MKKIVVAVVEAALCAAFLIFVGFEIRGFVRSDKAANASAVEYARVHNLSVVQDNNGYFFTDNKGHVVRIAGKSAILAGALEE